MGKIVDAIKRLVRRKSKDKSPAPIQSWDKDIDKIYDDKRKNDENAKVQCEQENLQTIYSSDREMRCVFFRSANGLISYEFEMLSHFDEDELQYMTDSTPVWCPFSSGSASFFDSIDDAKKEMLSDPTYKAYFK